MTNKVLINIHNKNKVKSYYWTHLLHYTEKKNARNVIYKKKNNVKKRASNYNNGYSQKLKTEET